MKRLAVLGRRIEWRPWNWSTKRWLITIAVSAAISPLITRAFCLWMVPDVIIPFDVTDIIQDEVSAGEDAFLKFKDIAKELRKRDPGGPAGDYHLIHGGLDCEWNPEVIKFLKDNRDIVLAYQAASDMEQANGPSLKGGDWRSASTDLPSYLRDLARFVEAQGYLFDREGDLENSWACHRAIFQSGVRSEKPGWMIGVLVGSALRGLALDGIVHWASNPEVTTEQLSNARQTLSCEYSKRYSVLDTLKAEYLYGINYTPNFAEATTFIPNWIGVPQYEQPFRSIDRFIGWSLGEPEISFRLTRQILVNIGPEIDRPKHERRKSTVVQGYPVFELDPTIRRKRGQLTATQLHRAIQFYFSFSNNNSGLSTQSRMLAIHIVDQFEAMRRCDHASVAAAQIVLAAQEFQRIHGEFPLTLQQLVPEFMDEIPFDATDPKGGLIRYRNTENGEAIVWYCGLNEIDNQGDFEGSEHSDRGFRIRLRR